MELPSLKHLTLGRFYGGSSSKLHFQLHFQQVFQRSTYKVRSLRSLTMWGSTSELKGFLPPLESLRFIELKNVVYGSEGHGARWRAFTQCRRPEEVSLHVCHALDLTGEHMRDLAKGCPPLRKLNIKYNGPG